MASNKRPPLELDDLTGNLKQSLGQGIGAFLPSQPTPQEEKNPVIREDQEGEDKAHNQQGASNPVPPVPGVLGVPGVPPVPGAPLKRVMKERWPVNIYHDQYQSLKLLAAEERKEGGLGSMSAMVREAIDKLIAERRQK
jgi:hypothetical protein